MSVAINSSLAGALNNQGGWKRKASDDEDERRDNIKKAKYSWYVTLESESPVPTDEDEESIYTVQGNETEFARDTSDTSTHTWVSSSESDVSVHVEYELDSRSENENPFAELSSCSEPENIVAVQFFTYFDSEGLADDSDAASTIDSEIKKADFRICVQCQNPNNNPMYRYCRKCYQMKKTYYPRSRPKRKPRAMKSVARRALATSTCSTTSTQELSEMDSGLASSHGDLDSGLASSQELTDRAFTDSQGSDLLPLTDSQISELTATFNSQTSETTTVTLASQDGDVARTTITSTSSTRTLRYTVATHATERDEVDSGNPPTECDSDEHPYSSGSSSSGLKSTKDKGEKSDAESRDVEEDPKTILLRNLKSRREKKEQPTAQAAENLCNICIEKPKNGIFVHGSSSHRCCCYKCAMKVWITNDHRCPICNRKVTLVTKDFCV